MNKEPMYTPFCECRWAFLQLPKPAAGKFRSAFEITLALDKTEHADLLNQIVALNKEAKGPAKINDHGHPIKADYKLVDSLDENGNEKLDENGKKAMKKEYIQDKYLVRFKSYADLPNSPDHIITYDSQGNVINRDKNFVANGSVVSVEWGFGFYDGGVSLYLNRVQIKELIEWKGKDFEDLGFEKVQGYVSGDTVETADGFPETTDDGEGQDGSPVEDAKEPAWMKD